MDINSFTIPVYVLFFLVLYDVVLLILRVIEHSNGTIYEEIGIIISYMYMALGYSYIWIFEPTMLVSRAVIRIGVTLLMLVRAVFLTSYVIGTYMGGRDAKRLEAL